MRVMFSGTWHTIADVQAVLNHPGHSSQKSHGRRRGGPGTGRDISRDHDTLARIYNANVDETGAWIRGKTSDPALLALAREQGFDAHPTVLGSAEFDRAVAEGGHTVMYRGIVGTPAMSAADIHAETREGDYQPGFGMFGNGYYMASGQTGAAKAATFADGTPGSVGRYALDARARTITYTDLLAEYGTYFKNDYDSDPVSTQGMTTDFGRYAIARGYDAIHVPVGTRALSVTVEREEWVILNRGALIADGGQP